eukprot:CAMPEP_0116938620 /NCGR_PEP_ID=MMETSP0467-20121206/32240_1 /TAXON_ID=283647 /ORGANISM="Mesodinium pulex, Strain SPMC105" /LENGTH=93 /DNA_ID=CAMNT_0004620725 /DNA_START=21 /DNA_END=300 /DNA_ORIENTATION=-
MTRPDTSPSRRLLGQARAMCAAGAAAANSAAPAQECQSACLPGESCDGGGAGKAAARKGSWHRTSLLLTASLLAQKVGKVAPTVQCPCVSTLD